MVNVTFGNYTLSWSDQVLPLLYDIYCQEAKLVEVFDNQNPEDKLCYIGLSNSNKLELVISQRYSPDSDSGFNPGILLIGETNLLFIGAGERLLAYKLDPLERLWENKTDVGFWGWERFDQFVIMSAELELAV